MELGKIIQKHGWKRAGYVVTIKIYWSMKSEERGLSRKHIIESVKASLLRLQLSYVDVVIIYKADPMCPMEGESPFIVRFRCISMPITTAHMLREQRESHIHFLHYLNNWRCWLYTAVNRPILFEWSVFNGAMPFLNGLSFSVLYPMNVPCAICVCIDSGAKKKYWLTFELFERFNSFRYRRGGSCNDIHYTAGLDDVLGYKPMVSIRGEIL